MRRGAMSSAGATFVLALALVGLASGNGSAGNAVPPTQWAGGACTAITNWFSGTQQLTIALQYQTVTKRLLETAAGRAEGATQTFAQSLRKLGKPEVPSGQQAAGSINKLAVELMADRQTIKNAVDRASASKEVDAAYASSVKTISTTAPNQIIATFQAILKRDATGRLKKGLKQAPSCKSIPDIVNVLVG